LFSFERYNGTLGAYPTNNKSSEATMARRFIRNQTIKTAINRENITCEFSTCFDMLERSEVGSLESCAEVSHSDFETAQKLVTGRVRDGELLSKADIECIGRQRTGMITGTHLQFLKQAVSVVWGNVDPDSITGAFKAYDAVQYLGVKYGSNPHYGNILASWNGVDGCISTTGGAKPGQIVHLLQFYVTSVCGSEQRQVDMAYVNWFQGHSERNYFQTDIATVWTSPGLCVEPDGPSSFIPLQRIVGRFLQAPLQINRENVIVAIRRPSKVVW
jgi:hypothetical protein